MKKLDIKYGAIIHLVRNKCIKCNIYILNKMHLLIDNVRSNMN